MANFQLMPTIFIKLEKITSKENSSFKVLLMKFHLTINGKLQCKVHKQETRFISVYGHQERRKHKSKSKST